MLRILNAEIVVADQEDGARKQECGQSLRKDKVQVTVLKRL